MRRRSRYSWTVAALALIAMMSSSVASAWAATCEGACGMPAMPCCEPADAEPPAAPQIRALSCCDQRRPAPGARAAHATDLAPGQVAGERVLAAPVAIDSGATHPASRPLPAPGFTPAHAAPPPPAVRPAVLLI